MRRGITTLTYAVRLRVVGYYLGQLALMLALLNLVPFGVALVFGEPGAAWRQALVIAALLLAALAARRLPMPERVQSNEAIAVVGLAFVLASALAALPLSGAGLPLLDAWFEAVSAVTTTGLSTAGSVENLSPTFLFTRAWMQWYGGLGIAVLSVALMLGHQAAARRLVDATESEDIAATARTQSRQVLGAYLVLTVSGVVVLGLVTGDAFQALLHILAAVSTGGFSPFDASLAALPRSGAWVVMGFSLLGALPLLLVFHACLGRGSLFRDPEARALLPMTLAVCALLAWSLNRHAGMPGWVAVEQGLFLGISAQSTTGFSTWLVADLDATSKLVLMAAMAVGGSTGSTAGGIKLLRLLVMARLLQYFLQRTAMPPHAAASPRLGGRPLEAADVELVALVSGLFVAAAVVSWLAFLAYGHPPLDALFEVVSALGTVGLSTGIAGPDLQAPLKALLGVDMLLGRLELIAVLVLLYPRTWFGRRS